MPGTPIDMGAIRILIAEDDDAIRALLDHHLSSEGFRCAHASDGISALGTARDGVDLAILDIGLPRLDGLEVARMLRREGRRVPILMLTGRSDEVDRIVGFEIGADDYVTKPFLPREIVARVRAILRRTGIAFEDCARTLRFGRLVIDEGAREARVDGADVGLKPREFALLLELASNAGVALSRSMLLERVWGFDYDGDERTVDVHVRRLRAKIEERHGSKRRSQPSTVTVINSREPDAVAPYPHQSRFCALSCAGARARARAAARHSIARSRTRRMAAGSRIGAPPGEAGMRGSRRHRASAAAHERLAGPRTQQRDFFDRPAWAHR